MERQAFLRPIETALTAPPVSKSHPIPPAPAEIPELVFIDPMDDPITTFADNAAGLGVEVRFAADRAGLVPIIDELARNEAIESAVLSFDPEIEGLESTMVALGIEVVPFGSGVDIAQVDLGVTGAAGAIARTGSIVVDSSRAGGGGASLVPPVHLAVVESAAIDATTSDWWRSMAERYPSGPPSQLVFISGPSRSADIEQTLTVGVHGPKRVWVAVVGR